MRDIRVIKIKIIAHSTGEKQKIDEINMPYGSRGFAHILPLYEKITKSMKVRSRRKEERKEQRRAGIAHYAPFNSPHTPP